MWKRGHFAWEYKGKRKNLGAAYQQLLQYREALENPPLLVVCDLDRFEVHTNFTATPTVIHAFSLRDLLEVPEEPLRVLRAVMWDPEALRPGKTREQLTAEAAEQFASLALALRSRGHDPQRVAHFLNKLLFIGHADRGNRAAGLLVDCLSVSYVLRWLTAAFHPPGGHHARRHHRSVVVGLDQRRRPPGGVHL